MADNRRVALMAVGKVALAADAEVRAQTPPRGDRGPFYRCPACGMRSKIRGTVREHLLSCESFRAQILGFTLWLPALPALPAQLS